MIRYPIGGLAALVALAVTAAGCRDTTFPFEGCRALTVSPTGPALALASARDSIPIDSAGLRAACVGLSFVGAGAAGAQWTVTHGGAPWLTLETASGRGDGAVRWTRDASNLGYGNWVDTITVRAASGARIAQVVDSFVIGGVQPTFVTSRRPWRPGERDSAVAYVNRTLAGGEYSFAVAQLLATTDSVTEVVRNPALAASARAGGPGPIRLGQAAGGTWTLIALDIRVLFPIAPGSATMDSLNWLGVFWYASVDSTWKGRVVAATAAATINKTTVNTTSFDASGAKSGAGGGESRTSLGQYWEANSGKIWVTSNACSPSSCANSTFTSGPWVGGLWHGILMGGQLITVLAPCVLPVGCTTVDTFNINFGTGPVGPTPGLAINCVFPSPCTGAAAAALVQLGRRRARLRQALTGELFAGEKPGAVRLVSPRWPRILP